jgi:hypothetical protein
VRESFTEYKKTLEQNLMNISYLYNGDVIWSIDSQYTEIKNSPLTSPTFMINSIVSIYQESFDIMKNKSKEFVIPEESIIGVGDKGNLFDKISELGIKSSYIFCSDKGKKIFGSILKSSSTSAFPYYFYSIDKVIGINVEIFYSPLIKEYDDEIILYVTDGSIQSLVYSIQNMDYKIEPNDEENIEWKHTMFYNLYDCRFNSYKLSIRNVSRLRNDKINKILNDN